MPFPSSILSGLSHEFATIYSSLTPRQVARLVRDASAGMALLVGLPLYAPFGASLSGKVRDASGAVIPNATVTLKNPATGEQRTTVTGQ